MKQAKNTTKDKTYNRDMTGRPINRSKTWGEKINKDAQKSRRLWHKEQQQHADL